MTATDALFGDVTATVRLARTAYRVAGIEPAKIISEQFDCADPQRLLAALLMLLFWCFRLFNKIEALWQGLLC